MLDFKFASIQEIHNAYKEKQITVRELVLFFLSEIAKIDKCSMTIPIGQRMDKLPIDSYWIARRFDETTLHKITYAAEQLLGIHLTPELDQYMK